MSSVVQSGMVPVLPEVEAFLKGPKGMLIDGEEVQSVSGRTFETINPSTGGKLTDVAEAGPEDVDRAVRAARRALSGPWGRMAPAERTRLLNRLADLIEQHAEMFSQLESLNAGRTIASMRAVDIPLATDHFRYFAGWATKIHGATMTIGFPDTHAYTRLEPIGVVGAITPWNFPLVQAAYKLAPALAAGCTVVLKPAEQTPLTSLLLGKLALEAGFPPGVLNVCPGFGDTGRLLVEHPGVDKIAFTGSVPVGKEIARRGAETLKRVSLELGGKSPNIIFPDADIETAARTAANSFFFLSGQVCTAGSRVFVHKDVYQDVMDIIVEETKKLRMGPGMSLETDLGPLVSKEQLDRVSRYAEIGRRECRVAYEGTVPKELGGFFAPPMVLTEVSDNTAVAREEIFGPVLSVMKFETMEEVIARANDTEYGLAAGVWTRDISKAHKMAAALQAGTVWVNCYNFFDVAMPFGGYKYSGYDRDCGYDAVRKYLETKSVIVHLG